MTDTFDGVVAWGLFFLLGAEAQRQTDHESRRHFAKRWQVIIHSSKSTCSWLDAMTGRASISLGHEAYRSALEVEGISLVGTYLDEGQNYHYSALKR